MKKFVAVLICICMVLSVIPAFAASDASKQKIVNETFKGEIIVSVEDAEMTGTWKKSSAVKNYDGGPNYFADKDATATFKPEKLKKGNYELYYWTPLHTNNAKKIDIQVFHGDKKSFTYYI